MKRVTLADILTAQVLTLPSSAPIQQALDMMVNSHLSSLVIVDTDKCPHGIFTERDSLTVISGEVSATTLLADIINPQLLTAHVNDEIHDAYLLMSEKGYRHLVVVDDNDQLAGVVTQGDFLRHIGFDNLNKAKQVSDVMTKTIVMLEADVSISRAAEKMTENRSAYAVIVDQMQPIGLVTERDILRYASSDNARFNDPIRHIYQSNFPIIAEDYSLQDAAMLMEQHGVHQVIIANSEHKLVGLLTRYDLLQALHGSHFEFLIRQLNNKSGALTELKDIYEKLLEDKQRLAENEARLERILNYDALTNIANRNLLQSHLKLSVEQAQTDGQSLALIIFDLDRFRDINDSFGHASGDEILIQVAERLTQLQQNGILISRMGGDEFAIVINSTIHPQDVAILVNHMIDSLSQTYRLSNDIDIHMGASAGIALFPEHGTTPEHLIQHADAALYLAKSEGRNTYRYYSDELTQLAQQRINMEGKLRQALLNNELRVYYQPQVHVATDRIIGAEALVRWLHPTEGMIFPDAFIPLAEESGLINLIGEYVLTETCRQGKLWLDQGFHLTLAVNVSSYQFQYQDIHKLVETVLSKTHYPANRLELEITESALMQREEASVVLLHALRAMGVRLAIDDFGTGYSSLSYLKRFPLDVLKIDKSFIDEITFNKDDVAIVKTIIAMAKALNFSVLAEGVERIDQLVFLREQGCDLYQGYYKSRPVSADVFEKLLRE